ncbi:unnamed protein product [Cyprideis torosa]|uniref:PHF7/G2E3-like PHD zinc finger domain-containing protein n=1 Tax=Cyprideis torosa TaxID=163714 RepID=A0A7R8ZIJ9_9CRUS|nr:unnamed protein product [Cyprideis torosa]CAG0880134.1 unnamed protein product [Cyprideis torosa]
MQKFGIHCPQKDAVWEVEGHFNDLLVRPDRCSVVPCKCPNGVTHDQADTSWDLLPCVLCGSESAHKECGKDGVRVTSGENDEEFLEWHCPACLELKTQKDEAKKEETPAIVQFFRRMGPEIPSQQVLSVWAETPQGKHLMETCSLTKEMLSVDVTLKEVKLPDKVPSSHGIVGASINMYVWNKLPQRAIKSPSKVAEVFVDFLKREERMSSPSPPSSPQSNRPEDEDEIFQYRFCNFRLDFLSQQWSVFSRMWWLYDARGQDPFRSAQKIGMMLQGQHKPIYGSVLTDDPGDHVIVINTKHITMHGWEWRYRNYMHHTGYPGGAIYKSAYEVHEDDPTTVMRLAVFRAVGKRAGTPGKYFGRTLFMSRLHLFPEDDVPEELLQNVSNQMRQLKEVPKPLDEEEKKTFPNLFDWPDSYVIILIMTYLARSIRQEKRLRTAELEMDTLIAFEEHKERAFEDDKERNSAL